MKRFGLLGFILCVVLGLVLFGCAPPKPPVERPSVTSSQAIPPLKRFTYLRKASWLNHTLVVLRHTHTAQRVVVFTGSTDLTGLYQQGLSLFNLNLLMPVLQAKSAFAGASLHAIQMSTLAPLTLTGDANHQMAVKRYRVQISPSLASNPLVDRVDVAEKKQAKPYDAWLGKLVIRHKTVAVVFTFNEAGYVTPEPFQDLLKDWSH